MTSKTDRIEMIQEIDDARRAFEHAVLSHALGRTDAGEYGAAIHRLNTFMHHLTIAAAAPPSGQVCVDRDDLELAIEWMDQTDNPWSGEAFRETWAASLVARDQLKDALHESYVTEGVAR